jgi:5-methylcytosine-specific restriction enzyme A
MPSTFKPQLYQGSKTVDRKPERGKRLYDCKRWREESYWYRVSNPECVICGAPALGKLERKGNRSKPLGAVDHIVPHREDQRLFWDESNWQTLCTSCHNRKSAGEK